MNDEFNNEGLPAHPSDSRFEGFVAASLPKIGTETPEDRTVSFPMIQLPDPITQGKDQFFTPHQHHGFDEVRLKADIKTRDQDEFEEQIGWIYWRRDGDESSESSSSSLSSSSGSSSSQSSSGSAKDSCIIPVSWGSGYTALYVVESKDVIFIEIDDFEINKRVTKMPIDEKFIEACLPGSLKIYGLTGEDGLAWGKVARNHLVITRPFLLNKATKVSVLVIGLRADCDQNPWPEMNQHQFDFNEERIKSFHPRD